MDGWWHERNDKFLVEPCESLDGYEPLKWVTARVPRIVELCRCLALGRHDGSLDLRTPIAKRLRSGYFMLLHTYQNHNEANERGWDLPDWVGPDDVVGKVDAAVKNWSLESFLATDVTEVRSALAAHLGLLDGVPSRSERKLYNRTLFLVGTEAQVMYNAVTRIPTPTRAEKARWKAGG